MDMASTADACQHSSKPKNGYLSCESDSSAARRRRMEIRRIKLVASSDSSFEPVSKRSRALDGSYIIHDRCVDSTGIDVSVSCSSALTAAKRLWFIHACAYMEQEATLAAKIASLKPKDITDKGVTDASLSIQCTNSKRAIDLNIVGASEVKIGLSASPTGTVLSLSCGNVSVDTNTTESSKQSVNTFKDSIKDSLPLVNEGSPSVKKDSIEVPKYSQAIASASYKGSQCPPPHGVLSICGRRRAMEDALTAMPSLLFMPSSILDGNAGFPKLPLPLHFFGVYDGHGGSEVSLFCKNELHKALVKEVESVKQWPSRNEIKDWNVQWQKVMTATFLQIDDEVGGVCPKEVQCQRAEGDNACCVEPVAPETVGTTAVVALVSEHDIIVANCGDSRAVLSRGGKAIPLSSDHKPQREDEMARVEAAGGRVIYWDGYRVSGFLAMSRAIGDRFLKPFIIAEPEVTCTQRTDEDECLILASDGLWDVVSNEMACEVARKCFASRKYSNNASSSGNGHMNNKEAAENTSLQTDSAKPVSPTDAGTSTKPGSAADLAASILIKLAIAKGSSDNISVVVIDLRTSKS